MISVSTFHRLPHSPFQKYSIIFRPYFFVRIFRRSRRDRNRNRRYLLSFVYGWCDVRMCHSVRARRQIVSVSAVYRYPVHRSKEKNSVPATEKAISGWRSSSDQIHRQASEEFPLLRNYIWRSSKFNWRNLSRIIFEVTNFQLLFPLDDVPNRVVLCDWSRESRDVT